MGIKTYVSSSKSLHPKDHSDSGEDDTYDNDKYNAENIPRPFVSQLGTYRRGTGGCGFGVKVQVTTNRSDYGPFAANLLQQDDRRPAELAFFKAQVGDGRDPYNFRGEFHIKEIVSSYLDTLLGTHVVPPCVGFQMPLDLVVEQYPKALCDARCILEDVGGTSRDCPNETEAMAIRSTVATVGGSLMRWVDGDLEEIKEYKVQDSVTDPTSSSLHESAIRYAIFYYIAGCLKTVHNHFKVKRPDEHGNLTWHWTTTAA